MITKFKTFETLHFFTIIKPFYIDFLIFFNNKSGCILQIQIGM